MKEKMKNLIIALMVCLPLTAAAQGNWEKPGEVQIVPENKNTVYKYAKYLGNVVPEVNGEVIWEKTFADSKNAEDNYALMLNMLTAMTKEEIQLDRSSVTLVNKEEHKIICHFEEWLTFANTALNLDRTRFIYTLTADCEDNKVVVRIFRISYWYDENRKGGERYKAEEWITDKWALNKKKTRLAKLSGKFRRKTVDRVEAIFGNIATTLREQ